MQGMRAAESKERGADLKNQKSDSSLVSETMFRLLPIQILLAMISAINGIVSSLFASNFIGVDTMSAIGLYNTLNIFLVAVSTMMVGGTTILYGRYIGKNDVDNTQNLFSLSLAVTFLISALTAAVYLFLGLFDLTGFMTKDAAVRAILNRYLIGQSIGVVPLLLGNLLAAFLSLENRVKITTTATLVYIAANVVLSYLFVLLLKWEAFGLALASSLGVWAFFACQAQHYLSRDSQLRFSFKGLRWGPLGQIFGIGVPGAASYGYQTLRSYLVNLMILQFVGSVGVSAFSASDSILRFFWAVPTAMLSVSRMMISVNVGEEDRKTLADVMRTAMYRFVPLMAAVSALIIVLAVPLTRTMYRDASDPVYMMTVWGYRILPLCMPLSVICMHFTCYGQASGKQVLVNLLALLDGVVCVAGFTALLIRTLGMNSVYIANVLNGVVTTLVIIAYSWIRKRHFPKNMDELMVIPDGFGVPECDRMDLSLHGSEEVAGISQDIQRFCREKGIDERRAFLAALFMEEMAGNIIDHGFTKVRDSRGKSVDVRVVYKNDALILRLKDDSVPFDPETRRSMMDPENPEKNIGIRLVYGMAENVRYQNMLGMNVLTIRI